MDKNKDYRLHRHHIYRQDGYRCVYCGQTDSRLFTLEHVAPIVKGGVRFDTGNIVTACCHCNSAKGQLDPVEWLTRKHQILRQRLGKLYVKLGNRTEHLRAS